MELKEKSKYTEWEISLAESINSRLIELEFKNPPLPQSDIATVKVAREYLKELVFQDYKAKVK